MTTNKQLRELARKATVGPWWIDSHGHRMSANGGLDTVFIADDRMGPAARHPETGNLSHWPNDWDASYIAAANPERVLALLDEIEALQAECEELRQEVEALQGIQPEMPPMPSNGKGLPRYGVRWNGPTQPLSVPKDDGYWTPWHLAQAECAQLRAAIRRLCNIYVVDDYYMGKQREEMLDRAVNRAIEELQETTK